VHHSERARKPADGAKEDWRDSKAYWRVWQSGAIPSGLMWGISVLGAVSQSVSNTLPRWTKGSDMQEFNDAGTKRSMNRRSFLPEPSQLQRLRAAMQFRRQPNQARKCE
jgi:hypothetical protein